MKAPFRKVALFAIAVAAGFWAAHDAPAATRGLTVELRENEASGAPVTGAVQLYGSSHALVIGIDEYTNGWPQLSKAIEDARAVAAALKTKGFSVTLKTNLNSGDLEDALKEFFVIKGTDPESRLFLWYAGHGHTIDGEGFLIPADAPRPDKAGPFRLKALSLRRIGESVRLAQSKHAFAVFDSCFSGTVFESVRALPPAAVTRATTLPVRQFLTSGDAGQTVSDDGTFRELFLRALAGEQRSDANRDGYVTGSEIGLFLTDKVTNLTQSRQTPRYGKLRDIDWDQGDFVFQVASTGQVRAEAPPLPTGITEKSAELLFWETVSDSKDSLDYEDYLARYPDGSFTSLAKRRIARLKEQKTASLAAPEIRIEAVDDTYVALKTANVRSGPSVSATKIGSIARDNGVTVTGLVENGKWLRIERPDGKTAFVFGKLLSPIDSAELEAWNRIKNNQSSAVFKTFLRNYPSGHFAARAKALEAAMAPRVAAIAPPKIEIPRPAAPAVGVFPERQTAGREFKDCNACPEMVVVPAGSFQMGDLNGGGAKDEKPVHDVSIGYDFAVGKHEVTFTQWEACVSDGGCAGHRPKDRNWGRGSRPVFYVSWEQAKLYIVWLSRKTGQKYRLLSEAEWEYMARAGTKTIYEFGNRLGSHNANYDQQVNSTTPVGSYPANRFGIHDVHGNVWEWVEDCWHTSYEGAPTDGSAWISDGDCGKRVARGGSWANSETRLRVADRLRYGSSKAVSNIGFRVAREIAQ